MKQRECLFKNLIGIELFMWCQVNTDHEAHSSIFPNIHVAIYKTSQSLSINVNNWL